MSRLLLFGVNEAETAKDMVLKFSVLESNFYTTAGDTNDLRRRKHFGRGKQIAMACVDELSSFAHSHNKYLWGSENNHDFEYWVRVKKIMNNMEFEPLLAELKVLIP